MTRLKFDQGLLDRCLRINEAERQFGIIYPQLTWDMLAGLEPLLGRMLHNARNADGYRSGEQFCRESVWYRELKPQLVRIVGHCRPDYHPILATSSAYELAYHTLLQALPPCRNCRCCEG